MFARCSSLASYSLPIDNCSHIIAVQQNLISTMSRANQVLGLLQSHIVGDDQQFLSVAMQVAARGAP
jgi:hypothetical protein